MTSHRQSGFTIVELLIVIVVIGILAAVTIVGFNGVQNQAKVAALRSNASQAAKTLATFKLSNASEQYPADLAAAEAAGLEAGDTITYQYSVNNSATPPTFCLTAVDTTMIGTAYYVTSENNAPQAGSCPGHSSNPGFTNRIANPVMAQTFGTVVNRKNFFDYSYAANVMTRTPNVSFDNKTWERYSLNTGSNAGHVRHYAPLSQLINGATYTTQWEVANDGTESISVASDWCDISSPTVILAPGESRVITMTGTRATYDSIYRFADLNVYANNTARSILVRNVMIERGSDASSFFNGSTAQAGDFNYAWTGAANASVSEERANGLANWQVIQGAGASTVAYQANESGTRFVRYNRPAFDTVSTYRLLFNNGGGPIAGILAGEQATVLFRARASVPTTVSVALFAGNGIGPGAAQSISVNSQWQDYRLLYTFSSDGQSNQGIYMAPQSTVVPLQFDVANVAIVEGNYTGPFFE